jgi:hypothetical protein
VSSSADNVVKIKYGNAKSIPAWGQG